MKIAILGAGKMGGWLARELAMENEVAVYDRNPAKARALSGVHALRSLSDLKNFQPALLINAVSLQDTIAVFESAVPHLPGDCMLADGASIKGALPGYYVRSGHRFVSVHSMFGPTHAKMEALKEENAIIIKESDAEGKKFFREFFTRLGVHLFEYTFQEHDAMMAYSLTTPFASSLVFAATVDNTAVPGTNFRKQLQLAHGLLSEDDHLLAEILFNPHSLGQLEKITGRLEFLKHIIKGRDYEEMKRFLDGLRKNVG